MSRREVERLVARTAPEPDVAPLVRKLPARKPSELGASVLEVPAAGAALAPCDLSADPDTGKGATAEGGTAPEATFAESRAGAPPPAARHRLVTPLSPDRYQIRFTASAGTCEKLRLAQELLRHAVPDGDPAAIFDRALTALLDDLGRRKFATTKRPGGNRAVAAGSRGIPAALKRAVTARDEGRCAFVASSGRRCGTRAFLEFHDVIPYARGGPATEENIQLRCRAHNGYEAALDFGQQLVPGRVGAGAREEGPGRERHRVSVAAERLSAGRTGP